ncbi:MAG: hypothetical protein JNK56_04855, partial [Myxococcales bacterium]|nr:hypothetical protein [Myxococcales bacterium]
MRPGQRPHEPHGALPPPDAHAPDAGVGTSGAAAGSQADTRASGAEPQAGTGKPGFSPALQFANTAVGDTALALSPSVVLSGRRDSQQQRSGREAPPAPPLAGEFGPYTILRQVGA